MELVVSDPGSEKPAVPESRSGSSERQCVGCRESAPREELIRFALTDEAPFVAPDPQRKLGGRGCSIHPRRACIVAAVKRGGFARAAKKNVSIDAEALCATLAGLYERRSESLLLAASRRKQLAIGTDAVREALRGGRVETLVIAVDAEGRREELTAMAERLGRRCCVMGTKVSLGRLFGRDEVGVLGILDRRIGDEVVASVAVSSEMTAPITTESKKSKAGRAEAE